MTELWHYPFVQQAIEVGVTTAVVAGIVGHFVAVRSMGFAVHGLAEVGFAGAAGATLLGVSPDAGLRAACLAAALIIGVLGVRLRERDVATGTVLTFGMGLGVLFLSLYTRYASEAFSLLFGSILAVSPEDVRVSVAINLLALVALGVIYRPLWFASVDPDVAEAKGVPLRVVSASFLLILALTVAEAVQVVGVLLISTLLITPAGIAHRLTAHPVRALLWSMALSTGVTLGGIVLALVISWPVSFFVSALSFATYAAARGISRYDIG